jgi:hypothetical protein
METQGRKKADSESPNVLLKGSILMAREPWQEKQVAHVIQFPAG